MLAFLYSFSNIFQPGIYWPELAPWKPMVILSVVALLAAMRSAAVYPRSSAFGSKPFVYLMFFLLIQVVSVYYSGFSAMLDEFNFWYAYAIYVVVLVYLIKDEVSLINAVWGMICGGFFIVGYGIYAVLAGLPSAHGGRAGAYGMYENHNDYSFVIILILPFVYLLRQDEKGLKKLFLSVGMLACVAGIMLSLSRGGMLALVLEGLLLILMGYNGQRKLFLIVIMLAVGFAGVGYQWAKRAENQGDIYTSEDAKTSRYELWGIGKNMVLAHPLLGVGSRRFHEFAQDYGEVSGDNRGKNSHNTYIEILTGTGLVGFLLFFLYIKNLRRTLSLACSGVTENRVKKIGVAVIISLYSILLRALLDAKVHDWSFYTLCALGVASVALLQMQSSKERENTRGDEIVEAVR
ncbi:MAG: O-antigen ligase family protein [Pseudomonadota bacterium]